MDEHQTTATTEPFQIAMASPRLAHLSALQTSIQDINPSSTTPPHARISTETTRGSDAMLSTTESRELTYHPGMNTPDTAASRSREASFISSLSSLESFKSKTKSSNEKTTVPCDINIDVLEQGSQKEADGQTLVINAMEQEGNVADKVDYKSMTWWHAGIVMIAETISLGVLSLPSSLAIVGFVPGCILIVGQGMLAWYTGYIVYQFKMAYGARFTSFADAIALMFGKPGRWIGEVLQALLLVFIVAAHIVTFSIELNTLTEHGMCTVLFTVIGAGVCFAATLPRTFRANSWISIVSCISIATATLIAMIGIATTSKGPSKSAYAVVPSNLTSFPQAARAISNMILAYNGHIAYPAIIDEMKQPRDFPKAVAMVGISTTSFYLIVATVIYTYSGVNVASPALGSASPLISKIAWGIATPTVVVAGVIAALVAAKQIYRHVWHRRPEVMEEKSGRARGSWWAILFGLYSLAWIIASVIPNFGNLLALIGAMFGTWFALGFPAAFWLWMWWQPTSRKTGRRQIGLMGLCVGIFLISLAISVLGIYGSVVALAEEGKTSSPFSCANNDLRAG